ncbi:hypothetical protein [Pseudoalteromonas rubra]|uniref:hypothetical protein n=1 Tax=Pseudoalteromonas rubra TaxID=43658 RepID=UPI0006966ABB|nr:hypothetical protein [Pseudoalteromonas rubra]
MSDFITWLRDTWQAIIDWCYDIILFVVNAFMWVALQIFSLFLEGIRHVFSLIDPPEFISAGISAFTSSIPADVSYLLGATGFDNALAIIGLGYTFRLTRKLFTLGQW